MPRFTPILAAALLSSTAALAASPADSQMERAVWKEMQTTIPALEATIEVQKLQIENWQAWFSRWCGKDNPGCITAAKLPPKDKAK